MLLNMLNPRYETGRSVRAEAAAAEGEQLQRAVVALLSNVSRHDGGLYVCTADNGVTAPVERGTRILVRREYSTLQYTTVHYSTLQYTTVHYSIRYTTAG